MSPRTLDRLLVATLAVLTWEKIRWNTPGVTLTLTNILATAFVACFVVDRVRRRDTAVTPAAMTLLGFMATFGAVYMAGYFDLQNHDALTFWLKGIGSWLVHFSFLICGVAYVARRGRPLFVRGIRWFTAGAVVNCVCGVAQLGLQIMAGISFDHVLARVTGTPTTVAGINVLGRVGGNNVYRVTGLTTDPNHLGIMLCAPLLILLPYYLHNRPQRRGLGLLLLGIFVVQVLTLSRSAALGDFAGLLVLLPLARSSLPRPRVLALSIGLPVLALAVVYRTSHFVHTVISARLSTGSSGVATHLQFYQLVPPALDPHPLFGMGFNTFAVFYQFVTGQSNYGPHSAWVAILVETGIVGLAVYLAYFSYLVASAARIRLTADVDMSRLGLGMTAALIGTAVANISYLTMSFDYFFALALLAVAGSAIFAPAPATQSPPLVAPAGIGVRRA